MIALHRLLIVSSLLLAAAGCSSYGSNGRYTRTASDDISLHPEAKQDIETLLSASNNDATERAVLCIHSVYEAERTVPAVEHDHAIAKTMLDSESTNNKAKGVAAAAATVTADKADKDPSLFSFTAAPKAKEDTSRSCLKLCAPSPSDDASDDVRTIAKKYSDRCRTHFGELRTLSPAE